MKGLGQALRASEPESPRRELALKAIGAQLYEASVSEDDATQIIMSFNGNNYSEAVQLLVEAGFREVGFPGFSKNDGEEINQLIETCNLSYLQAKAVYENYGETSVINLKSLLNKGLEKEEAVSFLSKFSIRELNFSTTLQEDFGLDLQQAIDLITKFDIDSRSEMEYLDLILSGNLNLSETSTGFTIEQILDLALNTERVASLSDLEGTLDKIYRAAKVGCDNGEGTLGDLIAELIVEFKENGFCSNMGIYESYETDISDISVVNDSNSAEDL